MKYHKKIVHHCHGIFDNVINPLPRIFEKKHQGSPSILTRVHLYDLLQTSKLKLKQKKKL